MAPTLRHGDTVLCWLPRRRVVPGAIVLVELADRPLTVKRVSRVEPDGAVWVEGDNPLGSTDSRQLGAVDAAAVRGVVLLRLWPRPGRVGRRRGPNGPDAA